MGRLDHRLMRPPRRLPNVRAVMVALTSAICSPVGICQWLQGQAVAEVWGLAAQVRVVVMDQGRVARQQGQGVVPEEVQAPAAVARAPGSGSGSARPLGGYQVKSHYPESARRRRIEGTALLKMRITAQGYVEDVHVERSAGHPDLDQSAMEAVRHWRFEPARRGGESVAVWVVIPVEFKLQ